VKRKPKNRIGTKKRAARKAMIVFFLLSFIIFLTAVYFKKVVTPVVVSAADAKVKTVMMSAINKSVFSAVDKLNISYGDLVKISYGDDNGVSMIQAVTPSLNRLAREVVAAAEAEFSDLDYHSVPIPVGTFTGISLLSGAGPEINVGLVPMEFVYCEFRSVFEAVGINQTLHKMYITVTAVVTLILPVKNISAEVCSDILICENIIVGRVPGFYLNAGAIGEKLLNLVP